MSRIEVLSKHISNQIAAGEVVDRPASIVKELTENAIDAGSSSITIEIAGGGAEYIRVSDNGSGIHPEDVAKAFLRHATSKISTAGDLARIGTLGFRGEALSSIAAVSEVSMRTRMQDSDTGILFRIDGGEVKERIETGCAAGTTMEVRNLFYNVPARLKFLRSARSEAGFISDYVSRAIMSRPDISFKFINNGKPVYHSSGDGELSSAIYCVYGDGVLDHIKKADFFDGRFRISGFVGTEQIARPNRQHQSIFVNGRYVRSQQIGFGVQRAFETRLMSGRFPFFVLDMRLDLEEVDVNVHPNKMEIRFRDEQGAVRAATIAARMALGDPVAPVIVREDMRQRSRPEPILQPTDAQDKGTEEAELPAMSELFRPVSRSPIRVSDPAFGRPHHSVHQQTADHTGRELFTPAPPQQQKANMPTDPPPDQMARKPLPPPVAKMPVQVEFGASPYTIIGQLFGCYWVVQQGCSVFFIDQHAAHERRLYERVMQKSLQPDSQILLLPSCEKLTASEYDTLMENLERFSELGFEIEEFGPLTVKVRAVPSIMQSPENAAFLHEAIALMQQRGRALPEEAKRAALIQYSCKHAIKAGARLSPPEIEALLKEYEAAGVPMTCPHGRPVMVQMTKTEFEKMFKRVL